LQLIENHLKNTSNDQMTKTHPQNIATEHLMQNTIMTLCIHRHPSNLHTNLLML